MDILLVTIDCLRRDRCGVYGHHRDTTPTLDELARNGYVFDNAYATGPHTVGSFPGIHAGRLSVQTGDDTHPNGLLEGAPTIASSLRDVGWSTVAVLANPRIRPEMSIDRGFDIFRNFSSGAGGDSISMNRWKSATPDIAVGDKLYRIRERMRKFESVPLRYELPFLGLRFYQYHTGWPSVRGDFVVDEFLQTLSETPSPFFAWIHLMDIHGPIHPHTVTAGGLSESGTLSQFRSHAKRVSDIFDIRTEERYDSAVRYVDGQLRRILDWLRTNQMWDDTIIIVTADHGEALFDRGIYGHPGHYMYDDLLSVPLIVHEPEGTGGRVHYPFSLGWLHELVTELAGIEELDVPLVSSYNNHLSNSAYNSGEDEILLADSMGDFGQSIVARLGKLKHVSQTHRLAERNDLRVSKPGTFDLSRDPKERHPLDEDNTELALASREIQVSKRELIERRANPGLNESREDQLRQLGYLP